MAVGQTASADDHGGSASSATRVALPSETAGAIDPGGDTDWFRFEVPASGEVTAETTGSLDTVGTLYDAAGNELAANDDSANDDSAFGNLNFRIQRTLGAGIYYVGVESWGNDTGSYVLRLGFEASATATAGATRGHLRNFGDFDGDGKDDVLLRHENGRWHYYRMDGRRPVSGSGAAGLTPNTTVDVAGIGDFNGDGRDDVLVRRANGSWYYYPMDGRRSTSERGEAALTRNLAWQVAGIGDFDGDGKDDVLLRHENGRWHYYRMDGRRPVSGSGAAGPDAEHDRRRGGHRRLQRRRPGRRAGAPRQRQLVLLSDERSPQHIRARRGPLSRGTWPGRWPASATSTATARTTCCCATRTGAGTTTGWTAAARCPAAALRA